MNGMKKERLMLSVPIEYGGRKWREEYREGMKAGDLEGMTASTKEIKNGRRENVEEVLLCQTKPFVLIDDETDEILEQMVVEFEKNKEEVYTDWDSSDYGMYVKEIRKEEIVKIHYVRSGDEGEEDIRRLMFQVK